MSNNLQTSKKKDETSDVNFDVFFPRFILALRDFTLRLVDTDNKPITQDQYLENCLDLKSGKGKEIEKFNEPRHCLRTYFKKRKCFTFDRPGKPKVLHILDELEDHELDDDFVDTTHKFIDYVYNECEPLSLLHGRPVNGRLFASQVKSYVNAIREGAVPCIETARASMAISENEKAVTDTIQTYITLMKANLSMPTSEETFQDVHVRCKKEAFAVFQKQSLMDKGNKYKDEADKKIFEEKSNFDKRNHKESKNLCRTALKDLHSVIEEKLRLGNYSVAGGYKIYEADKEELKRKYQVKTNLGVQKSIMYLEFTKQTGNEEQSVLAADKRMTKKEKEDEIKRKAAEELAEQNRIVKKQQEDKQIEIDRMEKQKQEELVKLKEQSERDEANLQKRLDAINDLRVAEMRRQEEEGFIGWVSRKAVEVVSFFGGLFP